MIRRVGTLLLSLAAATAAIITGVSIASTLNNSPAAYTLIVGTLSGAYLIVTFGLRGLARSQ